MRNQVVADTIKIVSTSLLGLSVGCAQCHNHRYDPILQTDYYRMRAVIEPAYDPKKWFKGGPDDAGSSAWDVRLRRRPARAG